MGYQGFKELRVWQEAKELAIKVYKVTADSPYQAMQRRKHGEG
jgi:hypothetical protein